MFANNGNSLKIKNILSKHVGIENLITAKEVVAETGLKETVVRSTIQTSKKRFRKDGYFLKNGHIGSRIEKTYRTGFFITRRDSPPDIKFTTKRDFRRAKIGAENWRDFMENGFDLSVLKDKDLYELEDEGRTMMISASIEIIRRKKKKDVN